MLKHVAKESVINGEKKTTTKNKNKKEKYIAYSHSTWAILCCAERVPIKTWAPKYGHVKTKWGERNRTGVILARSLISKLAPNLQE